MHPPERRFTYELTLGQRWDIFALSDKDVIDLSGIEFNAGPTRPVAARIRAVADASGSYATLQIDPDRGSSRPDWFVIARLDGVAAGAVLHLLTGPDQPLLVTVHDAPPADR